MSRFASFFASQFDYFAARTRARLEGLTDEEYLWEPVAGCWSVRPAPGGFVFESGPEVDPAPVTTIAWRLVHVSWCLGEHGLTPVAFDRSTAPDWHDPSEAPGTAAGALDYFDRSVAAWKARLAGVTDKRLWEPMGPGAGPYGDDPVAAFVEHIHDEFIHHSAEIGVLRDLYRARL